MKKPEYVRYRSVFLNGNIVTMTDDEYRSLQYVMFNKIWEERLHQCSVLNTPLGIEPLSYYFHHILEKRSYEKYALCKWNIVILSWDIHNSYESNPDNQPIVKELKYSLLYQLEILNCTYDNDVIYPDYEQKNIIDGILGRPIICSSQ